MLPGIEDFGGCTTVGTSLSANAHIRHACPATNGVTIVNTLHYQATAPQLQCLLTGQPHSESMLSVTSRPFYSARAIRKINPPEPETPRMSMHNKDMEVLPIVPV